MAATAPPEYTSGRSEHLYFLERNGGRWLSLSVQSRASSAKSLPVFQERDVIKGRIELDLKKPEAIKGVTIAIQAATSAVGQEELIFLDETEILLDTRPQGVVAKLKGLQSWPFEFVLPEEVAVPSVSGRKLNSSGEKMYRLPPSFSEKASTSYIDYRLIVTVKRGFLKLDQTLSTNFGYRPITVPDPPSALRQLAYREGSPILGPDDDPNGWKVLAPVIVTGRLFEAYDAEVECVLAVAMPLCYAVGTFVPLTLTLSSKTEQVLDILSNPSSVRVDLVRSLVVGTVATEERTAKRTDNMFPSTVSRASFWSLGERAKGKHTLHGELEVSSTLQPSFIFPTFTIRYALEFGQFKATGFRCASTAQRVLVAEKVVVATQQTPGVRQWSRAPPGYEKHPEGDYNNLLGVLENGNQRFWHHGHSG